MTQVIYFHLLYCQLFQTKILAFKCYSFILHYKLYIIGCRGVENFPDSEKKTALWSSRKLLYFSKYFVIRVQFILSVSKFTHYLCSWEFSPSSSSGFSMAVMGCRWGVSSPSLTIFGVFFCCSYFSRIFLVAVMRSTLWSALSSSSYGHSFYPSTYILFTSLSNTPILSQPSFSYLILESCYFQCFSDMPATLATSNIFERQPCFRLELQIIFAAFNEGERNFLDLYFPFAFAPRSGMTVPVGIEGCTSNAHCPSVKDKTRPIRTMRLLKKGALFEIDQIKSYFLLHMVQRVNG